MKPRSSGNRAPLIVSSIAGIIVAASFIPWVDQRTSIRNIMDALSDPTDGTRWPLVVPFVAVGVVAAFLAWRHFRDRAGWSAWRVTVLGLLLSVTILTDLEALQERYGFVSGTVPIVLMVVAVMAISGLERKQPHATAPIPSAPPSLNVRETVNPHFGTPLVHDKGGIPVQTPGWVDHDAG